MSDLYCHGPHCDETLTGRRGQRFCSARCKQADYRYELKRGKDGRFHGRCQYCSAATAGIDGFLDACIRPDGACSAIRAATRSERNRVRVAADTASLRERRDQDATATAAIQERDGSRAERLAAVCSCGCGKATGWTGKGRPKRWHSDACRKRAARGGPRAASVQCGERVAPAARPASREAAQEVPARAETRTEAPRPVGATSAVPAALSGELLARLTEPEPLELPDNPYDRNPYFDRETVAA